MITTITVTGMGSVINNELAVIVEALRSVGYAVEVVNSHPDDTTSDQVRQRIAKVASGALDTPTYQPARYAVKVVAQHLPWGG